MHIKKAYVKKGVGGHLEEVVKGLLPKNMGDTEVQHNLSEHEHLTHAHPNDEILHVLEGAIYIHLEGSITLWKAGDRVFLPKHRVHSFKAGPEGCTYVIVLRE